MLEIAHLLMRRAPVREASAPTPVPPTTLAQKSPGSMPPRAGVLPTGRTSTRHAGLRRFSRRVSSTGLLAAGLMGTGGTAVGHAATPGHEAASHRSPLPPSRLHHGQTSAHRATSVRQEFGERPSSSAALERWYLHHFSSILGPNRTRDRAPVHGLTGLIAQLKQDRPRLSLEAQAQLDTLLAPDLLDATYETTHFSLSYATSGPEAVPLSDEDGTGVPDYIENAAAYLEYSWRLEVDTLGFLAPTLPADTHRMSVTFQDIGAYGYTNCQDAPCLMVIENDFADFPANDDPEGTVAGASKVTIAHEFKHATQFEASQWSESNWIELDATWMEDIAYPSVNDYASYINTDLSQVVVPTDSLEKGGSGSYYDATWEHSMSQRFGVEIITELWERRADVPQEHMLQSYDATLQAVGSSLVEHFTQDYMVRNYFTGARSSAPIPLKYQDAAEYLTSPTVLLSKGMSQKVNLKRLSGMFLEVNASGSTRPVVTLSTSSRGEVGLVIVSWRKDGSVGLQLMPLSAGQGTLTLPNDWNELSRVALILSNGGMNRQSATVRVE